MHPWRNLQLRFCCITPATPQLALHVQSSIPESSEVSPLFLIRDELLTGILVQTGPSHGYLLLFTDVRPRYSAWLRLRHSKASRASTARGIWGPRLSLNRLHSHPHTLGEEPSCLTANLLNRKQTQARKTVSCKPHGTASRISLLLIKSKH